MVLIKRSTMELSTSESGLQLELIHQTRKTIRIAPLHTCNQTQGITSGSPISQSSHIWQECVQIARSVGVALQLGYLAATQSATLPVWIRTAFSDTLEPETCCQGIAVSQDNFHQTQ